LGLREDATAASCGARNNRPAARVQVHVIVALLLLVLATLVAGPVGFIVVGLLLLVFAIVTGTLHLVIELLMLPFRAIGALDRDRS